MLQKFQSIFDLYNRLLLILRSENEVNKYIVGEIEASISLLASYLDDQTKSSKNLLAELKNLYRNINQPRVGLSDFFIWRDDYDEMINTNATLVTIKKELN